MYNRYIKRFFDFIIATIGLVILSPVLIVAFVLVKLDSKGPIFFKQQRAGYKGELFEVFKIRTMTDRVRKSETEILKDNAEVTAVGKVLRRTKVDELPQLINILTGDMSLVGPRPCLPSMVNEVNEDGLYRFRVKPGLTGLAQVNGNIYLPWPERWKYDRFYVENQSFILDAKILLKTVSIVLNGEENFIKRPLSNKK